jgi:hypothetical protein
VIYFDLWKHSQHQQWVSRFSISSCATIASSSTTNMGKREPLPPVIDSFSDSDRGMIDIVWKYQLQVIYASRPLQIDSNRKFSIFIVDLDFLIARRCRGSLTIELFDRMQANFRFLWIFLLLPASMAFWERFEKLPSLVGDLLHHLDDMEPLRTFDVILVRWNVDSQNFIYKKVLREVSGKFPIVLPPDDGIVHDKSRIINSVVIIFTRSFQQVSCHHCL